MKTLSIATRALHMCTMLLVAAVALAGCAAGTRPPQTQEQLLQLRDAMDQRLVPDGREMFQQLLARVKGEYDAYSAGRATEPPKVDILIISGGGDWVRSAPASSRAGVGYRLDPWRSQRSTP